MCNNKDKNVLDVYSQIVWNKTHESKTAPNLQMFACSVIVDEKKNILS